MMTQEEETLWVKDVLLEDDENDLLPRQKLVLRAKNRKAAAEKDAHKYREWRLRLKRDRAKYSSLADAFNSGDELAIYQLKSRIVGRSKGRAKALNIPHSITADDITIPRLCPVLGIPLFLTNGSHTDNSPSIDRIDPTKGYVPGNVCVISKRANTIKHNADKDEVLLVAEYIKSRS